MKEGPGYLSRVGSKLKQVVFASKHVGQESPLPLPAATVAVVLPSLLLLRQRFLLLQRRLGVFPSIQGVVPLRGGKIYQLELYFGYAY